MTFDLLPGGAAAAAAATLAGAAAPDAESRRAAEPRGRGFDAAVDEAVARHDRPGSAHGRTSGGRHARGPARGEPARRAGSIDDAGSPANPHREDGARGVSCESEPPRREAVAPSDQPDAAQDADAAAVAVEQGAPGEALEGAPAVAEALDAVSEGTPEGVVEQALAQDEVAVYDGVDPDAAVTTATTPERRPAVTVVSAATAEAATHEAVPASAPAGAATVGSQEAAAQAQESDSAAIPGLEPDSAAGTTEQPEPAPAGTPNPERTGDARGEAVRSMIASALREARGEPSEALDPQTRLEIFGHELRRAIEAALPSFEAPGRAQAAWLRTLGALAEADPSPGPLAGPGPETLAVNSAGPMASFQAQGAMPASLPVSPPAPAPAAQLVDVEIGQQILQGLRVQWRTGAGEARLHLQPEHLGAVDVSLKVTDGEVRAVVRAESPAVQDWIARHREELKASLDAQGLSLEELDVVVDPDERRRQSPGEAEPRRVVRRPATEAGEERLFEVRV